MAGREVDYDVIQTSKHDSLDKADGGRDGKKVNGYGIYFRSRANRFC